MRFGVCVALIWLVIAAPSVHANFQRDLMRGRAPGSATTARWTLADWLGQKNQIALADQWLALHRSSPVLDVNLRGGVQRLRVRETLDGGAPTVRSEDTQSYGLQLNALIFNLAADYEKTERTLERFNGAVGIRLLGISSQTTNLTARYGWQRRLDLSGPEHWDTPFVEGEVQVYIFSALGLSSSYRSLIAQTSDRGTDLSGFRFSAGLFVEVIAFRLFAEYVSEEERLLAAAAASGTSGDRRARGEGGRVGLRLFF